MVNNCEDYEYRRLLVIFKKQMVSSRVRFFGGQGKDEDMTLKVRAGEDNIPGVVDDDYSIFCESKVCVAFPAESANQKAFTFGYYPKMGGSM